MPRKTGYQNISIIVTPEQYALVQAAAASEGLSIAEYTRKLYGGAIATFTQVEGVPAKGTYIRRHHTTDDSN